MPWDAQGALFVPDSVSATVLLGLAVRNGSNDAAGLLLVIDHTAAMLARSGLPLRVHIKSAAR